MTHQFTPEKFATALNRFMAVLDDINFDHVAAFVKQSIEKEGGDGQITRNVYTQVYTTMKGGRYIRIVTTSIEGHHRSVHCFVDSTNGNILKSASWKAPEKKNPRGNIFNADDGRSAMTVYGTYYLR
jgi:hypothetical protein